MEIEPSPATAPLHQAFADLNRTDDAFRAPLASNSESRFAPRIHEPQDCPFDVTSKVSAEKSQQAEALIRWMTKK
jgi:hypothetical protein